MVIPVALVLTLVVFLSAPWLLLALGAPTWAPAALDVLVVVLALTLALGRWVVLRGRTPAPVRTVAPPKAAREATRSDTSAEVRDVCRDLDAALAALARTRLGGGGRAALGALPWYAILGAPESGKSTLLASSGLSFPSAPGLGPQAEPREAPARPVGKTRRCDVWLANEAILLDTAGRWAVGEQDAEWFAVLDRLLKHRGARALDGLLLTIPVDDLLAATEAERASLGRHLRARIEAASGRLGVAIPVYVVITKCDHLVGFSEAFASLDKRGRARPWGFTLGGASGAGSLEDHVRDELTGLARALRSRTAAALAAERRLEGRALAAELPAHFESTHEPLTALLAQMFVASVYGETPTLRGVYFTSATQSGRPLDRLLAGCLRASGIEPRPLPESALDPCAFFVHHLFSRVILPDAETAAPGTRARRRRALVHLSAGASSATLASVLAIASAFSWQGQRRAIDTVGGGVAALPRSTTIAAPEDFVPLHDALGALRRRADEGSPWSMGLGLPPGPRLGARGRVRYLESLREHVLSPLLAAEASELEAWGAAFETDLDREPVDGERARAHALLERQLRFCRPAEAAEPELDAEGRARLAHGLAQAWCGALGRPARACEPHAALLLGMTDRSDRPRVPRHERAIHLGRLGLGRTSADHAALDALIDASAGRGYDLTLARMVGATAHALTSEQHVRAAFTRRGWEEVVRERIDAAADRDRAWLLGAADEREAPASREALREAYLAAYVDEWRTFLSSVRVRPPRDATEALALLEDMTRGTPPPIGRLLAAVDDNARLEAPGEGHAADGATGLLASLTTRLASARPEATRPAERAAPRGEALVTRALEPYTRFAVREQGAPDDAPLGADVYADELALLRDALATYRDDAGAAGALETRLVASRRRVDGLVAEQTPGARDFFEHVLRPPVEAAALTSSRAMASAVSGSFCAAVFTPFSASLAGRYPFAAHGDDAALGEVGAFYRPGGTLWTHYDAALAAIAPRAGRRFALAARLDHGAGSPYSAQLTTFLARSQAITDGLFPPGASEPRIELDVRIHPSAGAASVRFFVGGATVDYHNGPETWTRVVWPGESPSTGARVEVQSARGLSERIAQDGEWGLFRLVEAAAQLDARPGERTHTARWHLPGHDVDVVVDLRPVRTECALFGGEAHPRALGLLRAPGVAAPRHIARGAAECAP